MPLKIPKTSPLIFISLLALLIFCWIEVDLYAPGFPQIRQHFKTTEAMIQLTLSLNFLGYFVSSLIVGPLADSVGRRPVLLGGSLLFVLGSLLCVLAPSLPMILLGRLIQGFGVSAPTTLAMTVIGDLYTGDKQIKLFSLMNSLVTITMAGAPILGAFLSETYGWRANFLLILLGAVGSTLGIYAILPETHEPQHRLPFSLRRIGQNYATLARSRFFLATALGLVLLATPYFVFIATIPFLFLETLRLPMSQYVYFQGAVVGLFAALSLGVPSLVGKVDARRMTLASISLSLASALLLGLHGLFLPDAALGITAIMCLYIAGIVWPCSCVFTAVFAAFPELKGSACALFSALRMGVMACGILVSGHLYDDTFKPVGILIFLMALAGFPLLLSAQRQTAFRIGAEPNALH